MTLLPHAVFLVCCLVSVGIGVLIANWIWRRQEERRREDALEPFLGDQDLLPIEANDNPGPWILLGDTNVVSAAAEGNAARVAALLREHSTRQPLSAAAE